MEMQASNNKGRRGKGTEVKTSAIADDSSHIMVHDTYRDSNIMVGQLDNMNFLV